MMHKPVSKMLENRHDAQTCEDFSDRKSNIFKIGLRSEKHSRKHALDF